MTYGVERVELSMDVQNITSAEEATDTLLSAYSRQQARRSLLKGTLAGLTSVAILGSTTLSAAARSTTGQVARTRAVDSIIEILSVARTAEQLAVTFYENGLINARKLGFAGDDLKYIHAALVEEQIHQLFLTANGGQSLATTFSFPKGAQTFTDLTAFVQTQQLLEGVFDSAYLAAVKEFAVLGRPDLAQVAGQIACVEAEHRILGRVIGRLSPADNWAFTPVFLLAVADAPGLVQQAGFLNPIPGNSYTYQPVSIADIGVEQRKPYAISDGNISTTGNG